MVGVRKVAVHPYQELDLKIVWRVLDKHLGDFAVLIEAVKVA